MKTRLSLFIVLVFSLSLCTVTEAQIENPFKKIKKKAEREANKKVDEEVDKAFDPDKKAKDDEQKSEQQQGQQEEKADAETQAESKESKKPELSWAKYDFVPGEEVFFEDNLEGEENGEFPSRWDIYSGNVENAKLGDDKVIMFREDSYIMPYLENADKPYLPDVFTLEFDCYFYEEENYQNYTVLLYDKLNQKWIDIPELHIYWNKAVMSRFEGWYPGANISTYSKIEGWRHVSISFNKRVLKVYLDDTRLLNIPNLKVKPTGVSLWGEYNQYNIQSGYIKNIRLAKGGVKLYDKMMQDGKIVATGIRFDVGKATLRPESMGIINTIAKMMKEHPEIKFSIEGHTDDDGDLDANQKLSEERAKTVMDKLVSMGISADRMSTKGFGESNPIATNNTAEGKANNRRVEFVKI
ncbi:MAG: OmpA family protein [Bacteroidetes bacterium]|nr:OmpA family protein [Bacteroidota bacterium]